MYVHICPFSRSHACVYQPLNSLLSLTANAVNARARLLTHGVPNRIREKRAAGLGEDQRDSVSLDHVAALPFHFVGSSTTEVPGRSL